MGFERMSVCAHVCSLVHGLRVCETDRVSVRCECARASGRAGGRVSERWGVCGREGTGVTCGRARASELGGERVMEYVWEGSDMRCLRVEQVGG